ncbi:MAG: acylphosphatase [Candidatus Wildermuthbacteria bacterium]|nr:acylphosphatase [Candidatus Wildermuthbacteria bacterium]
MECVKASLIVSGRVQGVLFRDYAKAAAQKLSITGWVRNLLDGTVQIACEGDKKNIELFIQEVRKGPPFSKVEHISIEYQGYKGEWTSFEIREFGF